MVDDFICVIRANPLRLMTCAPAPEHTERSTSASLTELIGSVASCSFSQMQINQAERQNHPLGNISRTLIMLGGTQRSARWRRINGLHGADRFSFQSLQGRHKFTAPMSWSAAGPRETRGSTNWTVTTRSCRACREIDTRDRFKPGL